MKKQKENKKLKEKGKQNKPKENFKLKMAKENLEHKKRVYETYLRACIKYEPATIAYSAIMAEELYHHELMRLMDEAVKKGTNFMKLMFGEPNQKKPTEIEKLKKEEEYYDRLIKLVENRISMMSYDLKLKMAKDAIEKMDAWFGLSKYENKLSEKDNKIKPIQQTKKPKNK